MDRQMGSFLIARPRLHSMQRGKKRKSSAAFIKAFRHTYVAQPN